MPSGFTWESVLKYVRQCLLEATGSSRDQSLHKEELETAFVSNEEDSEFELLFLKMLDLATPPNTTALLRGEDVDTLVLLCCVIDFKCEFKMQSSLSNGFFCLQVPEMGGAPETGGAL